ncbi:MAG: hypothetical protein WAU36_18220, partial [Cyclobacteriaceae bacterium]
MKRIELFEFEDFHWLPGVIRTGVTNLIIVLHKLIGTSKVIKGLILNIHQKHKFSQITDMGSGSGGPMLDVIKEWNDGNTDENLNLVLSDVYPNPQVVDKINSQKFPNVTYQASPLDATNMKSAPNGLKTMIASFHHMNPTMAKKILKSAQDTRQPILLYEIAKNNIPTLLWWILLPISL